ncbi:glycosyltransferase [Tabrizicola sp. J26]|uniref:glycosyltransferase family 2 protein n=1 Tax=Alitabrizicola rongguiensis TaxID=2909234 RepID=UPI001F277C15|nr:glycosyltransferase [Tabrizicola rongguiensis]MCF1707512.1 glycosyltransferase [Tabrizicola rongguiensis]
MSVAPWYIVHIELTDPPSEVTPPPSANAIFAVYRYRGAVIGYDRFLPEEMPLKGAEVAPRAAGTLAYFAKQWLQLSPGMEMPAWTPRADAAYWFPLRELPEDALARLDAALDHRRSRPAPVTGTVAICTRHRPQQLAECLASIAAECDGSREVIVVDNGPDAETEAVVRRYPHVRYVSETVPGLSRARNAAIREARGDVVIFVDDDVRPEPGWVEPILRAFSDPSVGVVCGLVLPLALDTQSQISFQFDLGFGGMGFVPLRFGQDFVRGGWRGVPVWTIGAGANMAVRRSASDAIGGFNEAVGPGRSVGGSEDSEFWHRLLFAGHSIVYEPLSVVRHDHRRDQDAMSKQAYGYSAGHLVALFAQFGENRDWGDLFRAFITIPAWHIKRIMKQPYLKLRGRADPQLWDWVRGYFKGLTAIRLAFSSPGALSAKGKNPNSSGRNG